MLRKTPAHGDSTRCSFFHPVYTRVSHLCNVFFYGIRPYVRPTHPPFTDEFRKKIFDTFPNVTIFVFMSSTLLTHNVKCTLSTINHIHIPAFMRLRTLFNP